MMEINILTLFREMFDGVFSHSMIGRAQKNQIVRINIVNIRDFAKDKHKTVDDTPYGGGPGMVLKVDVIDRAINSICGKNRSNYFVILLSPQGNTFNQKIAINLSQKKKLILICGHYEGFDERIREHLIDSEISIGDFILTGGEIPAMTLVDAVIRLIPGVLGKDSSLNEESFSLIINGNKVLEYPIYTKPCEYRGWRVPSVLQSGNHQQICDWRKKKSLERTRSKRPDLLK